MPCHFLWFNLLCTVDRTNFPCVYMSNIYAILF
jgi:hypothetical protein